MSKPSPEHSAEEEVTLPRAELDRLLTNAQLEGVRLAINTLAHKINNRLTGPSVVLELLTAMPNRPLPPKLLADAIESVQQAAADIQQAGQIKRIVVIDNGPGAPSTIDLDASTSPEDPST